MTGRGRRSFASAALVVAVWCLLGGGGAAAARGAGEGDAEPRTATLVVYTYDAFGEALQKAIEEHFSTSYGVQVRFSRFEDTGGLYNRLFLERDQARADVAIGLDNTYLARLERDGLFQPYRPANLELVDQKLLVDPEYRSIPFDYGGVTLYYDS